MELTTHFCVEVINIKRQLRGKLGHVVQLHVWRLAFGVTVTANLSNVCVVLTRFVAATNQFLSILSQSYEQPARRRFQPVLVLRTPWQLKHNAVF